MAQIKTYTAPIERLRPDDLAYTANIQLARRLANFATEQAAALKAGGVSQAQGITDTRRAEVLAENLFYPKEPTARATNPRTQRAPNLGGGSLGNQNNGRAPLEASRAASGLANILAPPEPPPAVGNAAVHHWWDNNPFPTPNTREKYINFGGLGLAGADPYGIAGGNTPAFAPVDVNGNVLGPASHAFDFFGVQAAASDINEPQPPAGGNYQKYGYGTGGETMGDTFGPPAPAAPASAFSIENILNTVSGMFSNSDFNQGSGDVP